MKIKTLSTNKYHLSFHIKRKHVKVTFYGQFQISMKFSAGQCAGFVPLSWGLRLDALPVGILTGRHRGGCGKHGLQARVSLG